MALVVMGKAEKIKSTDFVCRIVSIFIGWEASLMWPVRVCAWGGGGGGVATSLQSPPLVLLSGSVLAAIAMYGHTTLLDYCTLSNVLFS